MGPVTCNYSALAPAQPIPRTHGDPPRCRRRRTSEHDEKCQLSGLQAVSLRPQRGAVKADDEVDGGEDKQDTHHDVMKPASHVRVLTARRYTS